MEKECCQEPHLLPLWYYFTANITTNQHGPIYKNTRLRNMGKD
ncbi:MAG: hypothetical protein UW03_C0021G0008 [Candidatus Peregrinibacteria bacterium GW2011_GWA2_43_8]|nr:MAG: hypothetical protein UW03_C0021G0008 [Candidatus Peregrinibacteria bacterium GW2011_GWA2_43_8]